MPIISGRTTDEDQSQKLTLSLSDRCAKNQPTNQPTKQANTFLHKAWRWSVSVSLAIFGVKAYLIDGLGCMG